MHKNIKLWESFQEQFQLSQAQVEQFQLYLRYLLEKNKQFNLTAITTLEAVIQDHFIDSLMLAKAPFFSPQQGLLDVGSGGGFPGIPLQIMFPSLQVVLLEVQVKKVAFLRSIVDILGTNTIVEQGDWRTFLRHSSYSLGYVCARASLQPEELLRMFKPTSHYREATLVYWASHQWEPSTLVAPYVRDEFSYSVGKKQRRLIFFKKK